MAGVAKSVAHSWISGSIPQNLPAVARLADALELNFKTLLLGSEENHSATNNLIDLQESPELFDGVCHVTIRKLGPSRTP